MNKNDYYYAYSDKLVQLVDESSLRRRRTDTSRFFQKKWEGYMQDGISPEDFAEEAIDSLGLKRKDIR